MNLCNRITYFFHSLCPHSPMKRKYIHTENTFSKSKINLDEVTNISTSNSTTEAMYFQTLNIIPFWNNNYKGKDINILVVDSGAFQDHKEFMVNGHSKIKPFDTDQLDDQVDHGTDVVSVIVGNKEGIAPESQVYVGKLFQNGQLQIKLLEDILNDAVNYNNGKDFKDCFQILNLSLDISNLDESTKLNITNSLDKLSKQGIFIFVAAGNDSIVSNDVNDAPFPANLSSVIPVASISYLNRLSYFSNWWPTIKIAAPGEGIVTANNKGDFEKTYGTSIATPIVSAGAALVLQKYWNKFKTLNSLEDRRNLMIYYLTNDLRYPTF
jgi:subtilisin family serine protease